MTTQQQHMRSKALIVITSVLAGLQTLVAAGSLADFMGARVAALLVVIVSAAQVAVNSYISQSVNSLAQSVQVETQTITVQKESPREGVS